jgi:2-iminobutanoate/2-iminopropanoate deaminase
LYFRFFSANKPARACYQVAALPRGAKVEIEAIAVAGEIVDA